ncbi:hypothetical protein ABBQ38_013186 [Trebouxia sp. C0009 RCD-2024]
MWGYDLLLISEHEFQNYTKVSFEKTNGGECMKLKADTVRLYAVQAAGHLEAGHNSSMQVEHAASLRQSTKPSMNSQRPSLTPSPQRSRRPPAGLASLRAKSPHYLRKQVTGDHEVVAPAVSGVAA